MHLSFGAQDLLIGGTDTSWMTVEWAVSELLKNPELLAKATMELDRVVSDDRLVRESDLPNLPYIDCIIKETLRVHPGAPMLVPRLAREDASADGYDIPAGTTVLVNAWAIGRDPALWDAAEEFRPERFAGSEIAAEETDLKFKMLPFGSGRRMCPAFSLGLKVITLSLANLLHTASRGGSRMG
jgi:typhasterol/6-deoxotyphasterol 2alpha-hydroxylase